MLSMFLQSFLPDSLLAVKSKEQVVIHLIQIPIIQIPIILTAGGLQDS
jgi:hypothetical protein